MQSQQKTRIIDIFLLLTMGYVLAGCASSGADIMSDHDRSADFGSYKTYNFFADAGPENSSYQSFFSQYMIDAITIEMENRGYVKSDNPDLLVNFNAVATANCPFNTRVKFALTSSVSVVIATVVAPAPSCEKFKCVPTG